VASPVAPQTERPHIAQIAFPAALRYRQDMIGIPQMPASSPVFFKLPPGGPIELAFVFAQRLGIDSTERADAAITGKDLLSQVSRIGAQLPFVNAGRAAKREAALANFAAAPPAQAALSRNPAAGHGAALAHSRKS
jgi:hypothetical protein